MPPASLDVRPLVEEMIGSALRQGASDIHVEPTAKRCQVQLRVDGLLTPAMHHDAIVGRAIINRLMVLAHLLTYRQDVPQEGRFTLSSGPVSQRNPEMRLSIMPTTHGLRAAIRLPADLIQPRLLEDLLLPPATLSGLRSFAGADSGMLLLTGPAGSGKTTTIYALLEYMTRTCAGQSIVSLEDPVERDIPGVTQIEVSPFGELTYERTLRSILRQDPQVLVLGEIRDAATANLAVGAALTGHRLISTLHASDPAGTIARLLEMGLEPYQITSALFGVVAQRLLRRLRPAKEAANASGPYRGRMPLAEFVAVDDSLRAAILRRADAATLRNLYSKSPAFERFAAGAARLVFQGITDQAEVQRVLGDRAESGATGS